MDLKDLEGKSGIVIKGKFYPVPFLEEIMTDLTQNIIENLFSNDILSGRVAKHGDENYTVSEIALKVKKANSTITRHCQRGILQGNKVGKSWLISKEHYDNYINNH